MRTKLIAALSRRPDRAIVLPGLAALAGVVIAGVALLRAPPATVSVVPPGYVALVNQKGILQSDFITQTATETSKEFEQTSPAERRTVLREMIDEELLVQRGLALDLPENDHRSARDHGDRGDAPGRRTAARAAPHGCRAACLLRTASRRL